MIDFEIFFKTYLDEFNRLLPTKIIEVNFENVPSFNINGENFGLYTIASWRITRDNKYICGNADYEANSTYRILKELIGSNLLKITFQSDNLKLDPVLHFSNRYVLEIFSTFSYGSWTFDSSCGFIEGYAPGKC